MEGKKLKFAMYSGITRPVGFRPLVENREWIGSQAKKHNISVNLFLNKIVSELRMGKIEGLEI